MSEENVQSNEQGGGAAETGFINQDGTFGDMATAPESVRDFVAKKGFKSIVEMTGAHSELEGMLGQRDKLLVVPEPDDKEGWGKVYDRFGRPESADKYQFTSREGDPVPEDNLITMFKEYAYKKGMNQEAFQDTISFQMDAILAANQLYAQEQLEARNVAQKAIRGRFSTEDEYNEFTQKGMAFAEKFKLDDDKSVMDVIEDKGLAHDPVILDMLGQLSDSTVEDPLPTGGARKTVNRDDRIRESQKNPAFTNAMHIDHYKLMAEYRALFVPTKQEG